MKSDAIDACGLGQLHLDPGLVAVSCAGPLAIWAVVERATGAVIPRDSQPGLIPLYIGEPDDFSSLSLDVPELGKEASYISIASVK